QGDWVTLRQSGDSEYSLSLVAAAGPKVKESPPPQLVSDRETLAHRAFIEGEPIVANDYPDHPDASRSIVTLGMKSMILIPLKARGRPLGLLNIVSQERDHFTPELVRLLTGIGDGLGVLLDNAGLQDQVETSAEELAVVDRVSRILSSTLKIDEVYQQFFEEVRKLVGFDRAGIFVFNEVRTEVTISYLSGETASVIGQGKCVPSEGTMSAWVMESQETLVLDNVRDHMEFWPSELHLQEDLNSVIVAPLVSGETVFGTFALLSRQTNAFGERERVIVERLASQIAPAINNALLFRKSEHLALALESIGDAVSFMDLSGRVKFVNRAFEDLYGYKSQEIVGGTSAILTTDDPESRALFDEIRHQAILGGWKGELRSRTKSGDVVDVLLTTTPVRDNDGKVMGRISISRDITDRKRAEVRMAETARLASIGELASGVAHEINNPLCGISGYIELMMETMNKTHPEYDSFQNINKLIQRISDFVKSIQNIHSHKYKIVLHAEGFRIDDS
ncbi:MAG: GAF domain-containing protein, partial [Candidatus Marinimicrobia bacterium]|nr:GAF domain-containing protein [Candidatus Neomarinimicrobiota bacterium]